MGLGRGTGHAAACSMLFASCVSAPAPGRCVGHRRSQTTERGSIGGKRQERAQGNARGGVRRGQRQRWLVVGTGVVRAAVVECVLCDGVHVGASSVHPAQVATSRRSEFWVACDCDKESYGSYLYVFLAFGVACACSGNRANPIYDRTFARSRTPKRAKLALGGSAVHVRSRLCARFFGVGPKNEKKKKKKKKEKAALFEKGSHRELASSLDTASERGVASRSGGEFYLI